MAILEIRGGRITWRSLMNKSKSDLAHQVLDGLDREFRAKDDLHRARIALASTISADPAGMVEGIEARGMEALFGGAFMHDLRNGTIAPLPSQRD